MGNMHHSYLSDISGSSTEAVLNTTVLSERWVGGGYRPPTWTSIRRLHNSGEITYFDLPKVLFDILKAPCVCVCVCNL